MAEIIKLENNTTIILDHEPSSHSFTMLCNISFGSRYEEPKYYGMAHFIEHMLFKGTKKRNAKQIAQEVEFVGGDINAYTTYENTSYSILMLKEYTELAIDIISDMVINSNFPPEEIERERSVILQEIYECIDDPYEYLSDNFVINTFKDQKLGHNILGTIETVSNISRDDLIHWKNKIYTGNNIVISISGNFNLEIAKKLISENFDSLPAGQKLDLEYSEFTPNITHLSRELEQIHLQIGFKYVDINHEHFYAAQLFSSILGSGMSSRLFQEIREKLGLAYGISSYTAIYKDIGTLNIGVSTSNEHIPKLQEKLTEVINSMSKITEEELQKAKNQIRAASLLLYESNSGRSSYLLSSYLKHGEIVPISDIVKKINAINTTDLNVIFEKFIKQNQLSIVSLGGIDHKFSLSF